jgi:hypothetical protein
MAIEIQRQTRLDEVEPTEETAGPRVVRDTISSIGAQWVREIGRPVSIPSIDITIQGKNPERQENN